MLVSFAAAIEGGMSFGSEVTTSSSKSKSVEAEASGSAGPSKLLSKFVSASAEGSVSGDLASKESSVRKEAREHTEASVAITLYDRLRRNGGYIVDPTDVEDLKTVSPGALVEIGGTIEKNAIDSIIDIAAAAEILVQLGSNAQPRPQQPSKKKGSAATGPASDMERVRACLDRDRQRTPFSNTIMRCSVPKGVSAIVTLRTENLRDLTLSELHKNAVRVLGKVTRTIDHGEEICPFENYGMSLIDPTILSRITSQIKASEGITAELSEVRLTGPAIQILPLMVFV